MRATEQEISSIQEEMTSNQAKQEHCQKKQEELSGLLEDTKQEASRADAEEAELNAKSSLFERLRQLSEGIEELSKLQKAADTARNVLARKSEAADNAALEFSGLQAKYYAGEAARLAKKLEKARSARCAALRSTRSRRRGRMRYHLSSSSIRLRRTLQKRQGRNPMRSVTSPKGRAALPLIALMYQGIICR